MGLILALSTLWCAGVAKDCAVDLLSVETNGAVMEFGACSFDTAQSARVLRSFMRIHEVGYVPGFLRGEAI